MNSIMRLCLPSLCHLWNAVALDKWREGILGSSHIPDVVVLYTPVVTDFAQTPFTLNRASTIPHLRPVCHAVVLDTWRVCIPAPSLYTPDLYDLFPNPEPRPRTPTHHHASTSFPHLRPRYNTVALDQWREGVFGSSHNSDVEEFDYPKRYVCVSCADNNCAEGQCHPVRWFPEGEYVRLVSAFSTSSLSVHGQRPREARLKE